MRNFSILVNTSDGNFLYSGVIQDYDLDENGLKSLTLFQSYRSPFQIIEGRSDFRIDNPEDPNCYTIPGESLVIKGNEILNLNTTYYSIQISESEDEQKKIPLLHRLKSAICKFVCGEKVPKDKDTSEVQEKSE